MTAGRALDKLLENRKKQSELREEEAKLVAALPPEFAGLAKANGAAAE
jgi:hypothetical protein